ncbi:MAG: histidine--tRNA ligase, partial [Anaerolineae bacterium]|nr:histidine--tRNA ligase [Thermoflexales bacterium]MDW8408440.1 histidine--tRNA ligase [Anaerolineae bacterium]
MSRFKRVKGMQDILPEEEAFWSHVTETAQSIARRFGFNRLETPVLETTALFARGVGEDTDIVSKEMYTFIDRAREGEEGDSLTLRPEFTAGVMRAYIENGLSSRPQPQKLYSIGPIFRRERPQKLRYRQFHQFNAEIIGSADPAADLEILLMAYTLYRELGFKNLNFQLNSTGDPQCKPRYVEALKAYLVPHADKLAPTDRDRLQRNPLRVLDSKERETQPYLADAPRMLDYLNDDCRIHFDELRSYLDALEIPYTLNHRLVRGLDYYTKTVFELWGEGLGAQAALCGGGRYDGLIELLGGPPTPGVGFATGIERIVHSMHEQRIVPPALPRPRLFVAYQGETAKLAAVTLAARLRLHGIGVRIALDGRSLKAQLRDADR